jgi:diadenosine tetraphosphate (Ap4A) HIT family hydrolase
VTPPRLPTGSQEQRRPGPVPGASQLSFPTAPAQTLACSSRCPSSERVQRRPQPSTYQQTAAAAAAREIIGSVHANHECLSCLTNATPDLPPRDRVHVGLRWRAAHAFGTSLPGWLVVIPRRHVLALDELTPEESAELGPLLSDLTAALREVVQCEKTYVALFSEAAGFTHLHFHLIPRPLGLDAAHQGPGVFGLLGGDPTRHVPDTTRDQIAVDLARALPARRLADRSVPHACRMRTTKPGQNKQLGSARGTTASAGQNHRPVTLYPEHRSACSARPSPPPDHMQIIGDRRPRGLVAAVTLGRHPSSRRERA